MDHRRRHRRQQALQTPTAVAYDFFTLSYQRAVSRLSEFPDASGGERPDRMDAEWNAAAAPSAEELSEVFSWVDRNNDGLICAADLRSFMSQMLAFDVSEDEAERLLVFYGFGRKIVRSSSISGGGGGSIIRREAGAVVNFEEFSYMYQSLCGEQASADEQSMMTEASRVFDKSQSSGRVQFRDWRESPSANSRTFR